MKTVRTSDLLVVFLAVSGLALGCGDDTSTLDESDDPSQVGDGDGDSSHHDDEGDGDSSNGDGGDGDAEGDGDDTNQGDGDAQGDGDGDDQNTGDGDAQGDGDTGDGDAQGDGDTGDGDTQGDGDTGDGDTQGDGDTGDGDTGGPDFDADAAKAVLLRSCGSCHKYGHPKFSIVGAGNMLDMSAVQQRAESMADALYDAMEPMPPYAAQGRLAITSDERENLHAYLLSLRE